jgi:hypothetical protein
MTTRRLTGRAETPPRDLGSRRSRSHAALERAGQRDRPGAELPVPLARNVLRRLMLRLLASGVHFVLATGTNVVNVDSQLALRPRGATGRMVLMTNRGSEVFRIGAAGPRLVEQRTATHEENAALDRAAEASAAALRARGLPVKIVASRLNRRKIDLVPEPAFADPPKASIGELETAVLARLHTCGIDDLAEVVAVVTACSLDAGLALPRVSSDVKHVEIGLTDKGDAARHAFAALASLGVSPSLVLVAGDEFGTLGGVAGSDARLRDAPGADQAVAVSVGVEPSGVPDGVVHLGGGPDTFLGLLRDQLARRRRRELPAVDRDRDWTLTVHGIDPRHERATESLLTLADGHTGTRATPLRANRAEAGGVLVVGLYRGAGPDEQLLKAPKWRRLAGPLERDAPHERTLDLRAGLLHERIGGQHAADTVALVSLRRPGVAAMRAAGRRLDPGPPLAGAGYGDLASARRSNNMGGGLLVVAAQDRQGSLDRFAVFAAHPTRPPRTTPARSRLDRVRQTGFDQLIAEQRATWAARWAAADIQIDGDDELQHSVRVALYHLISAVAGRGEAAVGPRGATGDGYRGHVFWDSDVFVLPFLAATHPPAARAMLDYRLQRLSAACDAARELGLAGARFPWESAATGRDVTPRTASDRAGRTVAIATGRMEEHIVADVAWAAATYLDWTSDTRMARRIVPLLVETARWWQARARHDDAGRAHLDGVIGPDEYHIGVDDNAFTNVMARWNLRRASKLTEPAEAARFESLAAALVDGYDAATGRYEQFAGFFQLEPLVIAEIAPRPVAADLLLGAQRVAGAQVVKQADVLMLHHLVPDETAPGSLATNLDFYEPRTAHGSSLSPGIHAAIKARRPG